MKIGIIGTIWFNTPPKKYGGTEEVLFQLVNGLVERGHDVTFFGPQTAQVKAKLYATVKQPLAVDNADWSNIATTILHLTTAFDHAAEFDILHFQLNKQQDYIGLPLAFASKTPVLTTTHFQTAGLDKVFPDRFALLEKYRSLPAASISDNQQQDCPLHFVRTVYNGLNVDEYPFQAQPDDYFVWIGKVKPEKGTKEAIDVARQAGVKLKLLGVVDTGIPAYKEYFEKEIKPACDGEQIQWIGEVGNPEKAALLGKAKGFLNPLQWSEPFGMVMIESLATGTPVIALGKGAVPELVENGKTGFVVDTLSEMVAKVKEIDNISRSACRESVSTRFSVSTMVQGYEDAYTKAINAWGGRHASSSSDEV